MKNHQLLVFIDRINIQRKFLNFHEIAVELGAIKLSEKRSGIASNMDLTAEERNDRLVERFLSLVASRRYDEIDQWVHNTLEIMIWGLPPTPGFSRYDEEDHVQRTVS